MKKNKYIILLLLGLMTVFSSCDDFLDVNNDPNNPKHLPVNNTMPVVLFYGAQTVYDHAEYGVYLAQALTTTGKSQSGSYAHRSGWDFMKMSRHPQWRRHFYDVGKNASTLMDAAEASDIRNYQLVARTIHLMSALYTTDMYGPMPLPFVDRYKQNSPPFLDQEDIYKWMFEEADLLIKQYNDTAWTNNKHNILMDKKVDRIYAGDMKKWRSFAYGLRARLNLRKLPNWEASSTVCNLIIADCNEALKDWEEPKYNYPGTGSAAELKCPWGPAQPKVNSWESYENQLDKAVPTKFLMVTMLGVQEDGYGTPVDPRTPMLMQRRSGPTGSSDSGTKYRFLESNIGAPSTHSASNYPNLFNKDSGETGELTRNDGYLSLMLTEELYLMKAEALYWANGDKKSIRDAVVDAVTVNMTRHGVTTRNQTRFLANSTYFPDETKFDIGNVMRHKYVCMYLQPEMWNDMRRYKYSNEDNNIKFNNVTIYPGLKRPHNLLLSVWGDENNKNVWIQRVNYDPQTEPNYNKDELVRLGAYENPDWMKKSMIWAE